MKTSVSFNSLNGAINTNPNYVNSVVEKVSIP